MDLLASIMKKMEKPPGFDQKDKERLKKQREMIQKEREDEQKRVQKFKDSLQARVDKFIANERQAREVLEPMSKPLRAIVHSVADSAGLVALSFGQEEVDRHVILFKAHTAPCEDEVQAMRRGEVYDPNARRKLLEEEQQAEDELAQEQQQQKPKSRRGKQTEKPEYLAKYEKHFGGLEVAKDAARSTETNRAYGFVSSEQKKDKRTIEETLADIRAKKRQKVAEDEPEKN